jgi:hypothetical protein
VNVEDDALGLTVLVIITGRRVSSTVLRSSDAFVFIKVIGLMSSAGLIL